MGGDYPFSFSVQKIEYSIEKQKESLSRNLEKILDLVSKGAFRYPTILTPETDDEKNERERNLRRLSMQFLLFFPHIYILKNPAFIEEHEWRIISLVIKGMNENELPKMEFRPLEDRIVPFRRIPLEAIDEVAIDEVIIGPRNATPVQIVEAALERYGWQNVTVRKSSASYR